MAKAGAASRLGGESSAGATTRTALIEAAVETLKADGFGGASARVIASRAGCAQALVFYHFGSVVDLLLAAFDAVSARRLERYRAGVAAVASPSDLVAVAAEIFAEDMASGDIAVLGEMIGGASATPGLGPEVAARIAPWRLFAADAITAGLAGSPLASIIPVDDLAYAVVALYLGVEMLSHLDGDRTQGTAMFGHLTRLAPLLEALAPTMPLAVDRAKP
jgi:AcrR family transcriptional regulator